ncbi:uncharacterized protein LOC125671346 isoform X2 [Ostrea edulis]|uniref:uncharacterized protein LOC125671346 isoform X2 n=1 Tax=Ostrea edulis TaxID=37623 RepID=UPI0024AEED0A|nr:uncharacterized protein LOC125671346 isoform X2 [Ostrea edulis]
MISYTEGLRKFDDIFKMGASLLSKLMAGICIIEVFLTNDKNTQMTWLEARDFCDSINSSLVDPFIDSVSTEGAFWTNRHMETHSSWIYIEGCTNTSSLGINSDTGRKISSVWECDNLCNHTELFGTQNSTCFCLERDRTDITEANACTVQCDNCTDVFPIQCCGSTDLVTVFGKLHITGHQLNLDNTNECLTCDGGGMYRSPSCSDSRHCPCHKEGTTNDDVDWKTCFQEVCEGGIYPRRLKDQTQCTGSNYGLIWLPVRRRHFDDNPGLCYRCINNTLNCQFERCDHIYKSSCRENSTLKEANFTLNNSSDCNSSLSVSMNWNSSFKSCFPNDTEKKNRKARISINGTFKKISGWVQSLGCIKEVNHSFPPSSVRQTIPYPSITLCEDICNTSHHFIVKNTTCLCVEYPNVTDPAVNDSCTLPCKDIPPLGLYCGGTSAFNVFKTYRETEIVSADLSHNCVLLNCDDSPPSLIIVSCNENFSHSGLCVKFNGESGSHIDQIGTWEFSANYCKERNEALPSSVSLCNTTGFRNQQHWSGLVRVGTPVSITDRSQPDPSSVLEFNCTRCENRTCRSISCSSNRSTLCQIKNINNQKTTTLSTIHATNIITGHNQHMTPSENDKSQIKDEDSNHLQIIGPVCAVAVIIAISIVVFIMYRRRRLKSNTGTNAIQLRDHVQNEYAVVKKTNREAAENPQSDENVDENQEESTYVDSKMDVYDHLGEKHKRKFVQQSDNIYNYSGPCDNQYGDLELPASDDTYDHAKTANTDNSEENESGFFNSQYV